MRLRVYPKSLKPVVLRRISRRVWPLIYKPGPQSGEPVHPSGLDARTEARMPKDWLKILLRAVNPGEAGKLAQRPVSRNRTSSVSRAELSLSSHSHTVSTCQPASSSRRR